MKRIPLLLVVITLLSFSTLSGANPGGVGDGDFDMQCGGGFAMEIHHKTSHHQHCLS